MKGTHVVPSPTDQAESNALQKFKDGRAAYRERQAASTHWLYCSYEEFMCYLHKRERELAELKRAKEVDGEN